MPSLTHDKKIAGAGSFLCIFLCALLSTLLSNAALADTKIAVGGGGWLTLDKQGLHLQDASSKTLATVKLRAKQFDARTAAGQGLVVVLDADTQHALPLRINVAKGELIRLSPLPVQAFGVESLCLFRDGQGLDHLFIAGKDGQAEQWLMQGDVSKLVRKLSMPLDSAPCQVDDASHTLYVEEPGVGTWAYEANSEAMPARRLLHGAASKDAPRRMRVRSGPAQKERAQRRHHESGSAATPFAIIAPRAQTDPVARLGDVADDPAIWVHPTDASRSRVLGTNKKQGLLVYDLQGKQQQFLASGRLNNVDLRQRVVFGGTTLDLAVASQRDDNTVVLYGIGGEGVVSELARFPTGFDDIYGLCLVQPRGGGLEVLVNDKGGKFRQYRITRHDAQEAPAWSSTLVREFKVASQPEGCVADDRHERLFIGEEKRGIWTLPARAEQGAALTLVLGAGKHLHPDVEGMAIYQGSVGAYLIVSSQGDSSYVVLDSVAPYTVRGRFKVGFNVEQGIDGTADTDGLDVTSANLGGAYAQGMLVIQDGYKRMPDGPQNFKYISWSDVAKALGL